MAFDFYATPFSPQYAILVDQEGAPVNAHVFLAVELFQLDHVKEGTQGLALV